MTPVKQDLFGFPDGNCFAACVASVLDRPLDDLRNVEELHRIGSQRWKVDQDEKGWAATWANIERELVQRFGVYPAFIPSHAVPVGFVLLGGKSPRGDFGHWVVARDGVMVHDPHPSGDGIVGEVEEYLVLVPCTNGARSKGRA